MKCQFLFIHFFQANSLWVTFLNDPELICLHIVRWFQVLFSNIISFNCTQMVSSTANSNNYNGIQLNIFNLFGIMVYQLW